MTTPNNPFVNDGNEFMAMFDSLVKLSTQVKDKLAKADAIIGVQSTSGFMPIKKETISLPSIQGMRADGWRKNSVESVRKLALKHIDVARAKIQELKESNKEAEEYNLKLKNSIIEFMGRFGITQSYTVSELPSPRHKYKQSVTKSAGFIADLARVMPATDVGSLEYRVNEYQRQLDSLLLKWAKEDAEEEFTSNTKKNNDALDEFINKTPAIVKILSDVADIDLMSRLHVAKLGTKRIVIKDAIEEALEKVLSLDKYLNLGYHLEKNRNDWNDGYSYAETGLASFEVVTLEDEEIRNSIQALIDDWDGDGRVFRDCEYNYSELYKIALKHENTKITLGLFVIFEKLKNMSE